MCETRSNFRVVLSSSGGFLSYSEGGGSAFVRRRIQTPSDATVLNVVQPEREVVLGASSPARRFFAGGRRGLAGAPAKPARLLEGIASDALCGPH